MRNRETFTDRIARAAGSAVAMYVVGKALQERFALRRTPKAPRKWLLSYAEWQHERDLGQAQQLRDMALESGKYEDKIAALQAANDLSDKQFARETLDAFIAQYRYSRRNATKAVPRIKEPTAVRNARGCDWVESEVASCYSVIADTLESWHGISIQKPGGYRDYRRTAAQTDPTGRLRTHAKYAFEHQLCLATYDWSEPGTLWHESMAYALLAYTGPGTTYTGEAA